MKNSLLAVLLSFSLPANAQDDTRADDKHEVKTNMFNLIVFKVPQFSCAYLINEESSAGASILFNLEK